MKEEEVLKIALNMEREAIERYTEMKKNSDPELTELLEFLIEEERKHSKLLYERLKAIKLLKKY